MTRRCKVVILDATKFTRAHAGDTSDAVHTELAPEKEVEKVLHAPKDAVVRNFIYLNSTVRHDGWQLILVHAHELVNLGYR